MRRLCFRFDVDSHRCLGDGTRPLAEVAHRHGVPFTFFVNMGRATHRPRALVDAVTGSTSRGGIDELPPARKLGPGGVLELLVLNPRVGAGRPEEVRRLAEAGHEIGLHGGRNHRSWQDRAGQWSQGRLREEVRWGLEQLAAAGVPRPAGFSSPAWASPPALPDVAADLGFAYLADVHDRDLEGVVGPGRGRGGSVGHLPNVVTNIVGEPGGVGYLEWMRARGATDAHIRDDVRQRLSRVQHLAVVYDHPFWAGLHDAGLVDDLVRVALEEGFVVTTLADAVADAHPI